MSGGHYHANDAGLTQNQGNQLGDRPCVRQSKLYREHVGGNEMKGILGQDNLMWDTNQTQGAYQGQRVHGEGSANYRTQQQQQQQQQQPQQQYYQQQQQPSAAQPQAQQAPARGHRPGAGQANRTTYNFMTGE